MTEVGTLTLASFLLARIAEDEAAWSGGTDLVTRPDFAKLSRHMLAECEAKRRIIEIHGFRAQTGSDWYGGEEPYDDQQLGCTRCGTLGEYASPWPCETIKLLALPYAGHLDFRPEWRPAP